jgi:hypothetical protein
MKYIFATVFWETKCLVLRNGHFLHNLEEITEYDILNNQPKYFVTMVKSNFYNIKNY